MSDYVELRPCDPEVFKSGHMVMMTHTIPAAQVEQWVQKVAALSGQKVDWHFAAGRACIMALGDLSAVNRAIDALMPEHDKMQKAKAEEYVPGREYEPHCTRYDDNDINTAHEYIRAVRAS